MKKLFESYVSEEIINSYRDEYQLPSHFHFNLIGNRCSMEFFISAAAILSPTFAEIDGCVFWASDNKTAKMLKLQPHLNKVDNEKFENVFEIGQFFSFWIQKWYKESPYAAEHDDDKDYILMIEIAEIIKTFWSLKLNQDFPDKEFVFEIGDGSEDFYGEYGVCLTFYEKV